MLRIAYMASDFHPLVLIHIDRTGLSEVIRALSRVAKDPSGEASMVSEGAKATHLLIQRGDSEIRLRVQGETLHWRLSAAMAADYAAELSAFLSRDEPSGSVMLEQGVLNEIPVKVTLGEFDDAFFE